MAKNITIKEETFNYLKSIKGEDESYSDVIMKLKNNNNDIMHLFGADRQNTLNTHTLRKKMEDEHEHRVRFLRNY